MAMRHPLGRRMAALATVFGASVVLPFAVGATPALAAPVLAVAKFHSGDFARGETGVYSFQVSNRSTIDSTAGTVTLTDTLPAGLTVSGTLSQSSWDCDVTTTSITCTNNTVVGPFQSFPVLELTVSVAEDAPCTVTNTVTVSGGGSAAASYSDPTNITGGDCDDDNGGGGGGSILPINLNGVIPLFNNISTNSNINSPAAGNTSQQVFGLNAP
ncbi:hypothetical protein ACFWU3_15380 [Streptomyces sp. NPDC058685]|uniref:hypothetical protein n=1 Tax=Streptomyces sp. NPDC058685 TaxID=3346598 RepID=UPI003667A443